MPKLKTPCSFRVNGRWCGAPCTGGTCQKHAQARVAQNNARRSAYQGTTAQRGYGADYRKHKHTRQVEGWRDPGSPYAVCFHCRRAFDRSSWEAFQRDSTGEHIRALIDGGTGGLENIALSHDACNKRAGTQARDRKRAERERPDLFKPKPAPTPVVPEDPEAPKDDLPIIG